MLANYTQPLLFVPKLGRRLRRVGAWLVTKVNQAFGGPTVYNVMQPIIFMPKDSRFMKATAGRLWIGPVVDFLPPKPARAVQKQKSQRWRR